MMSRNKYTAAQYLAYCDPHAGDKDSSYLILHKASVVRIRKPQKCTSQEAHEQPIICAPGSIMRKDDALFDGEWHHMYTCTMCMDKWLEYIGI